jgi:hypothetical protein
MSEAVKKLAEQHAHRAPTPEMLEHIRIIRKTFFDAAVAMVAILPPSREASLVQTKIDEARMWACNAATLGGEIKEPLTTK